MGRLRLAGRGWSAGCGFAARLGNRSFRAMAKTLGTEEIQFG